MELVKLRNFSQHAASQYVANDFYITRSLKLIRQVIFASNVVFCSLHILTFAHINLTPGGGDLHTLRIMKYRTSNFCLEKIRTSERKLFHFYKNHFQNQYCNILTLSEQRLYFMRQVINHVSEHTLHIYVTLCTFSAELHFCTQSAIENA